MTEYIGKHEPIQTFLIKDAMNGACFHGEVWVICPHCGESNEVSYAKPWREKDGYKIVKCACGRLYKYR